MPEVVGVRFRGQGKVYDFNPNGYKIYKEDFVIVETSRGTECAEVVEGNYIIADEKLDQPLKDVIRIATPEDMARVAENRVLERKAITQCEGKIAEHKLDMHLLRAEYSFDRSKLTFFFTSDGRVDFRTLVRDLASIFRTRIELRQIGVRDEAKMLGGLGICGREFCCSSFLNAFQPVSIKMAKVQGLSLNPTKISGTCGRLMCCLNYEQETYEELIKTTPRKGNMAKTTLGVGKIIDVNILTGMLTIIVDEGDGNTAIEHFHKDDVKIIKNHQ